MFTPLQITAFLTALDATVASAWFEPDPMDFDSISWFHIKVNSGSSWYGNTPGLITYLRTRIELEALTSMTSCP